MRVTSQRAATEQASEAPKAICPPRCPVCGGPLVELRASLRCSRCYFTICEGCSGDQGDDIAGAGD